jgi:hypothetical protein
MKMTMGAFFNHDALDTSQDAIRLIEVLPDRAANGVVQCHMWHTTCNSRYRCLSYTWGPVEDTQLISLDGRPLSVRLNLWKFLNAARIFFPNEPFWIDAICLYSYRTAMKHLGILRFAPLFSGGINLLYRRHNGAEWPNLTPHHRLYLPLG